MAINRKKNKNKNALIIVCGLQGTGKSTVAAYLTKKIKKAIHLRSDIIRKKLFSNPTYSEKEKEKVYIVLLQNVKTLLKRKTVILDATFSKNRYRILAKRIAENLGASWHIIETTCSEEIVKKRLKTRTNDASDAKFIHYLEQKPLFETIRGKHIIVDTSMDLGTQLNDFLEKLKKENIVNTLLVDTILAQLKNRN